MKDKEDFRMFAIAAGKMAEFIKEPPFWARLFGRRHYGLSIGPNGKATKSVGISWKGKMYLVKEIAT